MTGHGHCLYNANHLIPVFDAKGSENRNINVNVSDSGDKLVRLFINYLNLEVYIRKSLGNQTSRLIRILI